VSSLGVLKAILDFTILSLAQRQNENPSAEQPEQRVAGELLFRHDSSGFLVLLRHLHPELEWKDAELCQARMIKSGTKWRSASC
jgi:hypothetical protein